MRAAFKRRRSPRRSILRSARTRLEWPRRFIRHFQGSSLRVFACVWPLTCLLAAPALAQDLDRFVDGELSGLVGTYKSIHAHPELSHQEEKTASLLAAELRKAG